MTDKERVIKTLNGEKADRLPVFEWATWWDKTLNVWKGEESTLPYGQQELFRYFGLDSLYQYWVPMQDGQVPVFGADDMSEEEYTEAFRTKVYPHLFPEQALVNLRNQLLDIKALHDEGKITVWFTLEGFFWFPRTLFGIENHLYAFYDHPELMHEINQKLVKRQLEILDVIYDVLTPEFMTFAEDMSYNHGPMIGKGLFDEFMSPYYKMVVPEIKKHGTRVLIDTDGAVEPLIPWFEEVGIEGVLPLERQAGVDVNRIRKNHPKWIMIGGYDKTIMHKGEAVMRAEFERILPAIKSGRYIPSVDHQTPPDVSIENYRIYVRLLKEYSRKISEI